MSTRTSGVVLALVSAAAGALASPPLKVLTDAGWSATAISFWRVGVCAVVVLAALLPSRGHRLQLVRTWRLAVPYGVFGIALNQFFYTLAIAVLPVSEVFLIIYGSPAVVVLVEAVRKRRWPTRRRFLGVSAVVVGLATTLVGESLSVSSGIGFAWAGAALICNCVYFWTAAGFDEASSPLAAAGGALLVATGAIALVAFTGLSPFAIGSVPGTAMGAAWVPAVVVLLPTLLYYAAGGWAALRLGAASASLWSLSSLAFAMAVSAIALAQRPTAPLVIGTLVVAVGVVLAELPAGTGTLRYGAHSRPRPHPRSRAPRPPARLDRPAVRDRS